MKALKFISLLLVNSYKYIISPVLPKVCRYAPSCSEYSILAFKKYGFVIGLLLTIKRISRCHPWGDHGFDPVPENINSLKDIFRSK